MTVTPLPRMLRLNVQCPHCGARPRIRVAEHVREMARAQPVGAVVQSYQCHVRGCGHIYEIHAGAWQSAA